MAYDMFDPTQDQKFFARTNEQAENTVEESHCLHAAEDLDSMFNDLIRNIDPATLDAINAQEVNIDEFTMDSIDVADWQTDNSLFLEQNVDQQQQMPLFPEGRNPYSQVTQVNHTLTVPVDTRLWDARADAMVRARQNLPVSSGRLNEPQASQIFQHQPHASPMMPQHIYQPDDQTQAPWILENPLAQGHLMQDTFQHQTAGCQPFAAQRAVPVSAQRQSQTECSMPAYITTGQSALPDFAQAPIQVQRAIAAAAPHSMNITNFAEAQQAAATRITHYNYQPPANDDTFPQDKPARTVYIRQLYDAFIDITECLDSATVTHFATRWATLSTGTSPITPAMITTICYAVLTIATDLHTHGPTSLNVFDKGKLKNVYAYRHLTFRARIDAVRELLRMSKARCGNLLKFEGMEMVVATAPLLVRQTRSNYTHNRTRQVDLVAGKRMEEAGEMGEAGAEDEDEDGEDVEDGEDGDGGMEG